MVGTVARVHCSPAGLIAGVLLSCVVGGAGCCAACVTPAYADSSGAGDDGNSVTVNTGLHEHADGWDEYWEAISAAQELLNGNTDDSGNTDAVDTGTLRSLTVEYSPAIMFGADDDSLSNAASALNDEASSVTAKREQERLAEEQARAKAEAAERAQREAEAAASVGQSQQYTNNSNNYGSGSQSSTQQQYYLGGSQSASTANNSTASNNSTSSSSGSGSTSGSSGYSTNSGCSDVNTCQAMIDSADYNVMTPFHTAGGSTYYEIHNTSGGASMLGQNTVTIDGQTLNVGAWQATSRDSEGYAVGPDDGGQYVQTCGSDGNVYIARIQ